MKLILVRHGVTKENLERRFLGVTDVPLAPEGAAQAVEAARRMPAVDHIYVSPLIRCRQTATLVWPTVGQTVIPELRETDFGPFEGKTHEELQDDPLYDQWLSYPDDPTIVPRVENIVACALRATRALEELTARAKADGCECVGVVSHGGTLMSMLTRHGRPTRDYYNWRMDNCSGYVAELDPEELLLHIRKTI